MSFDADEEILQDFLVEAGEILELLSEQLVDLEQRPDDYDLLNAIFRGFHTVKGGAGFLQLNALVDCCHEAENVFDILRNGQRTVTSDLMDVILQALDTVNEMFSAVRNGQAPEPATPELLATLHQLAQPESNDAPAAEAPVEVAAMVEPAAEAVANTAESEDITDDEFEQLLDALDSDAKAATGQPAAVDGLGLDDDDLFVDVSNEPADTATSDEITEDEFEALLDQIHGSGKAATSADNSASDNKPTENKTTVSDVAPAAASSASDDLITDSEFEDLLDRLHGKGQNPATADESPAAAKPEETKVEAAKVEAPKPEVVQAAAAPAKAVEQTAAKPAPPTPPKPPAKTGDSSAPAAETTVRVDTKRLDDIMNMVGELVLVRNRLVRLGLDINDEAMSKAVSNLDVVTADLQSSVMKTRMQPIKKVFGRFPRVVRDLARSLKKEINLELRGEDTDLDKNLVEALADPLVHLVRNAVDHGVELPDAREAAGKSRVGVVVLAAEQEGDHILLSIEDDGGGMDPNVLRGIAVKKGVMEQDAADRLTDNECYNLIFAPGFSTKEVISDVSGRGVGMDVVKTKITQLNGTLNIDSTLGKGTRIEIKVPLTLAIMPTLMVMLKDQAFAFPLVSVNEIFHLDLSQTNVVDGQEVIVVRDKPIPLFHLKRWLVKGEVDAKADESSHVLVVSIGNQRAGFVVDQLIGQEEVVIKPLGAMLHGTAGMAGATITGDGRIALILDVPSMLQHYAGRQLTAA
ncbi:MAG: two-component system chemotaxis sensor kinase CheA [Oleispira sp.]|jgi:two-component system chemotaxis sensor kinase CheA